MPDDIPLLPDDIPLMSDDIPCPLPDIEDENGLAGIQSYNAYIECLSTLIVAPLLRVYCTLYGCDIKRYFDI